MNFANSEIRIIQMMIDDEILAYGKGIFRLRRKTPAGASPPPYTCDSEYAN